MRISDWSSDVCSADLARRGSAHLPPSPAAATAARSPPRRPVPRSARSRCNLRVGAIADHLKAKRIVEPPRLGCGPIDIFDVDRRDPVTHIIGRIAGPRDGPHAADLRYARIAEAYTSNGRRYHFPTLLPGPRAVGIFHR